eukprot:5753785-Prymnesium_polylepis.1
MGCKHARMELVLCAGTARAQACSRIALASAHRRRRAEMAEDAADDAHVARSLKVDRPTRHGPRRLVVTRRARPDQRPRLLLHVARVAARLQPGRVLKGEVVQLDAVRVLIAHHQRLRERQHGADRRSRLAGERRIVQQ